MAQHYDIDMIHHVCDYNSYYKEGVKNPYIDHYTYKIMDLKEPSQRGHNAAILHFAPKLNSGINALANSLNIRTLQIAIVPSSEKDKRSAGLETLITHINGTRVIYDPNFLVRDHTVPKAHLGGDRSYDRNIKSVSVHNAPSKDIPLILLDDVSTTGNSLYSCREILKNVGVKKVYMIVIGQTV